MDQSAQSTDRLLWLATAVIASMGLAWLLVEAPWSAPEPPAAAEPAANAAEATVDAPSPIGTAPAASSTVSATEAADATQTSDPLRLAHLALEAGMLVEPADYSAWTLFGKVATAEPDNSDAREGLNQVAAALLGRGRTALEQGRYDDARAIAETIIGRLPEHTDALALEADVAAATRPPEPAVENEPEPKTADVEAPAPVDPIPALDEAFRDAMARNAVLTPAGSSARDVVEQMLAKAPDHELTIAARDMLVTEMLSRSTQSLEAQDTAAAKTWIDSAARLAADPERIEQARDALTQYLVEAQTHKLLPASELTQTRYVAPEYPPFALNRGVEGWVEIEFVVSPEGETEDLSVVDALNDQYFREPAVGAVSQWRFEPVHFMGRAIPQHAYTRVAFVLK